MIALGGNAVLRRGQDITAENQRHNIKQCVESLAPILQSCRVTLVHGNGPQVGSLVLEDEYYSKRRGVHPMSLVRKVEMVYEVVRDKMFPSHIRV